MSRVCSTCFEEKPLTSFYREATDPKGRQRLCKLCITAYRKKYDEEHPGHKRDKYLRRTYGISSEDFESMLRDQGNACAICGNGGELHVDHCHASGQVRGLLCGSCNRALGLFKDNTGGLRKAIDYLETER